jgi:hypothetical protein
MDPVNLWPSDDLKIELFRSIKHSSEHDYECKTMKLWKSFHTTWVIEGNNISVTFVLYHICDMKLILASCLKSEKD